MHCYPTMQQGLTSNNPTDEINTSTVDNVGDCVVKFSVVFLRLQS